MPRRKLIFALAALVGGVSVALAALALSRDASTPDAVVAVGAAPQQPVSASGPHGGTVLTQGALSVEVVLSEKPGDARLVVYPLLDGKPVEIKEVSVAGILTRYDGTREALQFAASGAGFSTTAPVAKPHVFDASIDLRVRGRAATFNLSRADGVVVLSAEQIKAAQIGVARVGPAEIAATFQLPGEIKFNEDRTAHIVPRVAGIVERVAVSIGQRVEKGQLLAVFASAELADRRSDLLTAQRRLAAARTAYQREKTLWQERISAEQDYLQAQEQLSEAEIAVHTARQKLLALNAPSATGALNRYELRAPFAGTIVEKHVTPGEAIAADANVFVLSDLSTVWAEMAVPAQRLNEVRVGREATVSAAAFASQSRGPIAYVGALLGEQTRTAPARVVLPNPEGAWRPGMFVNVAVHAGRQAAAVAVASDALQDIDGTPVVFVQTPKGFVAQSIEAGRRDSRMVEIVSGLKAGQAYVAANSFVLKAELGKGSLEEE
jgi:cobalt-zinc-cadmium efflux system membrane fusion protein